MGRVEGKAAVIGRLAVAAAFYKMSKAKYYDAALVNQMLEESVRWFHEARKHPLNADKGLSELARECANGTFQNHVGAMPETRREAIARKFMEACVGRFSYEVGKAAAER